MTAIVAVPLHWPPVHWKARQRLRDPDEALWAELRLIDAPIDCLELEVLAIEHCEGAHPTRGETLRQFDRSLQRWVAAGFVEQVGTPPRYSLVEKYKFMRSPPAPKAPRHRNPFPKRTQLQRLWTAMKVLRTFDLPTLLMAAGANRNRATGVIDALERGGWLRRTDKGWTSTGGRAWGSIAPTISRGEDADGPVLRITDQQDGTVIMIPARRHRVPSRSGRSSKVIVDGGVS